MPQPRTTPNEHDVPVFQPGQPTPDDPRKESPMKDPPVHPEQDIERENPTRYAGEPKEPGDVELGDVESPDTSPDRVLFDENGKPG